MPLEKYRAALSSEFPAIGEFEKLEEFAEFLQLLNREDLEDYAIVIFELMRAMMENGIV